MTLLVAGLVEEMADRTRDFAADIRHALEQRPRQMADQFEVAEPRRQRLGRALADVLDAERVQEPFQRRVAAVVDGLDAGSRPSLRRDLAGLHGFRRGAVALVGAAFHFQQVVERQLVQIGDRLARSRGRTSSSMKRSPRPSMSIARREAKWRIASLRCAGAGQLAGAAPHRLAFLAHDLRAADRAVRRHAPRLRAGRALLEQRRAPLPESRRRRGARSRCRRRARPGARPGRRCAASRW